MHIDCYLTRLGLWLWRVFPRVNISITRTDDSPPSIPRPSRVRTANSAISLALHHHSHCRTTWYRRTRGSPPDSHSLSGSPFPQFIDHHRRWGFSISPAIHSLKPEKLFYFLGDVQQRSWIVSTSTPRSDSAHCIEGPLLNHEHHR